MENFNNNSRIESKQQVYFESLESLTTLSWIQILTGCMLFAALDDLPSEYYMFLRIFVFIVSILSIKKFYIDNNDYLTPLVIFILMAILVLFNPIIPIYFWDKSEWILPDMLAGTFFILVAFYGYKVRFVK